MFVMESMVLAWASSSLKYIKYMRTFRDKIWKDSQNADVMKKMKLHITEDLSHFERDCRNKLWPMVEQARKDGKKTRWHGPFVFTDGVKFSADSID